jgi:CubicO group peptidase (beta-lactamase class C family)
VNHRSVQRFNALGAIYEHAVGTPIFAAFAHQIAAPIGMQDFDPARCRYVGGPDSIYPAYVFYASARDLARFGLLYLRRGRWGDQQVIPAEWVDESTRPYSTTNFGSGYAYLVDGAARAIAGARAPACGQLFCSGLRWPICFRDTGG